MVKVSAFILGHLVLVFRAVRRAAGLDWDKIGLFFAEKMKLPQIATTRVKKGVNSKFACFANAFL
ncbi:MAG: hypothetical protein V3U10_03005, partial [Bacteroidota bacterium]